MSEVDEWRQRVREWWGWYRVTVSHWQRVIYVVRWSRFGWPLRTVAVEGLASDIGVSLPVIERAVQVAISRRERAEPGQVRAATSTDDQLAKRCPTLLEYLTATRYDDGSPRQPGSVLIFAQDGVWKGMLRDRDAEETLWVTAQRVADVMPALEAALTSPSPDWRADRPKGGGGTASRRRAS